MKFSTVLNGLGPVAVSAALLVFTLSPAQAEDHEASSNDFPVRALSALGAAGMAKELCTAVYVSGREPREFLDGSSKFWMIPEDKVGIRFSVDRPSQSVTLTLANGINSVATFYGAQGCVVHGPDGSRPDLPFTQLRTDVLDQSRAWPIGDSVSAAGDDAIDQAALDRALDAAFADDAHTSAFLVLHRGKLVAERYAPGFDATTRLPGWSITKSLTATIVGRLEQQQRVQLFAPINLPEWQDEIRSQTTLADLLRMSAPIDCGNGDPQFDYGQWRDEGYPYYLYTFSGPEDAYAYSVSRPPLQEGKPRGYYANCQPHVTGRVLTDVLASSDETVISYAQSALFEPLGMRSVVMETDRVGNPLTAGYSLATARDWARLGLLYAQEGMWEGERLLSKEFMSFVRAPAPHWEKPIYGGQVWLRQDDCSSWDCGTYSMNGIEGQRTMIVPSRDLVVVRLGDGIGDPPSPDPNRRRAALVALDAAGAELMRAFPSNRHFESDAVEAGLQSFFDALGSADREAFDKSVTADFTLYELGEVWSGAKIFGLVAGSSEWNRRWTISQPKVTVSGDLANIVYRNTLRAERGDDVRVREWLESASLVRKDGRWVVQFLHSTDIAQISN